MFELTPDRKIIELNDDSTQNRLNQSQETKQPKEKKLIAWRQTRNIPKPHVVVNPPRKNDKIGKLK